MEKVKVGFYLKEETKKRLDTLREQGIKPNDFLDTILQFDLESAQKYLDLYKMHNPVTEKYNSLKLRNGGFIFSDEAMTKYRDSVVSIMPIDEAPQLGVKNIQDSIDNPQSKQTDISDKERIVKLEERILLVEKALISVWGEFKKIQEEKE